MISDSEKLIFGALVTFHIFWLIIPFMMGEDILFGYRYFDNIVRLFTGLEILLSLASSVLIYKNIRIGYVFFGLSIISVCVISWGHRLGLWYCSYCQY